MIRLDGADVRLARAFPSASPRFLCFLGRCWAVRYGSKFQWDQDVSRLEVSIVLSLPRLDNVRTGGGIDDVHHGWGGWLHQNRPLAQFSTNSCVEFEKFFGFHHGRKCFPPWFSPPSAAAYRLSIALVLCGGVATGLVCVRPRPMLWEGLSALLSQQHHGVPVRSK